MNLSPTVLNDKNLKLCVCTIFATENGINDCQATVFHRHPQFNLQELFCILDPITTCNKNNDIRH
jgi:hypothetical protein